MLNLKKRGLRSILAVMLCLATVFFCSVYSIPVNAEETASVESIVNNMTLEEKISQLIIPSIRTWNSENVYSLSDYPDLAAALMQRQYGGVILYGENVSDAEQLTKLITELQYNNSRINATTKIPYFIAMDEEGGAVVRLSSGTRMNGSMAVGATGADAEANARTTGLILGEELAAVGVNVDFAPDIDVNNNPANPVIGTRSFSDDPSTVASLGKWFQEGLAQNNIIGTYKHFPGHGDTDTDTHIGTATVNKTLDEMKQCELVPFASAVENGAEMIMTAHITLPKIDDEVVLGDGSTGYYPATMSHKIITGLLRDEMGYDGIVVTDALVMESVSKASLVEGDPGSAEYAANISEKVLNAGCDILLVPIELTISDAVPKLDWYIELMKEKVNAGVISIDRINESVTRVLNLKNKYGILSMDTSGSDVDEKAAAAVKCLGSEEHHQTEMAIAEEAITLVKNDNRTLPLSGFGKNIVLVGKTNDDAVNLQYVVADLQKKGLIDPDACIVNQVAGTVSGSVGAATRITIGSYIDKESSKLKYSADLQSAVRSADAVIALTKTFGVKDLTAQSAQYQGIQQIQNDAEANDASFILLSGNLPYDTARFQRADAIVLSYMSSGLNLDPTHDVQSNAGAYNANAIAALEMMFDAFLPSGALPVNVPDIQEAADGTVSFTDTLLYNRGFGLSYTYQFTSGMDSIYKEVDGGMLSFRTNARDVNRMQVLVDQVELSDSDYTAGGTTTKLDLMPGFLNLLGEGSHTLTVVYDYGTEVFNVTTGFAVERINPEPEEGGVIPGGNSDPTNEEHSIDTPSKESSSEKDPKTGDENQPILWFLIALGAVSVVSGALAVRSRKANRK